MWVIVSILKKRFWLCLSVCLFIPSYFRQFRMYEADILQVCPGAHGDGSYVNSSKFPSGGDITNVDI